MANRIVIATPELVEGATLTGGGTISASMPVANLQDQQPANAVRWTSLTGMYVEVDLGAAYAINALFAGYHNGTTDCTLRWRGATSQANLTASPGYDSTAESAWAAGSRPAGYDGEKLSSFKWLTTAQTYRWWRLDIADAGNPDGYFDLGCLIVDAAFQPERNYEFGAGFGHDDPSPLRVGQGGQTWPQAVPSSGVRRFRVPNLTEDEAFGTIFELGRKRGRKKSVLVVPKPEATTHLHRQMIYGLMVEDPTIREGRGQRYAASLAVKELRP